MPGATPSTIHRWNSVAAQPARLTVGLDDEPEPIRAALGGGHAQVILLIGDASVARLLPNGVSRAYPPGPVIPADPFLPTFLDSRSPHMIASL